MELQRWASAFGIGGAYRWYFDPFSEGKSSLNGLFVGPRLDFFMWSWYDGEVTYSTLAIGAEVNYKWTFSNKWVVEPTVKFVFPVMIESGYSYTNYGFGVNLGYAF